MAFSFIKEKQNTLTLQSVQNIPTCGMDWTHRWYLWDTIKKRIKKPVLIVIKVPRKKKRVSERVSPGVMHII